MISKQKVEENLRKGIEYRKNFLEIRGFPVELARKMVGPWYLIEKREADIIREAFNNALKESNND